MIEKRAWDDFFAHGFVTSWLFWRPSKKEAKKRRETDQYDNEMRKRPDKVIQNTLVINVIHIIEFYDFVFISLACTKTNHVVVCFLFPSCFLCFFLFHSKSYLACTIRVALRVFFFFARSGWSFIKKGPFLDPSVSFLSFCYFFIYVYIHLRDWCMVLSFFFLTANKILQIDLKNGLFEDWDING